MGTPVLGVSAGAEARAGRVARSSARCRVAGGVGNGIGAEFAGTERFEVLAVLGVGAAAASVASLVSVPAFRFLGVICTELDMLPAEIESNSISNLSTDVIDVCLGRGDGRTSRG